MGEISLPISIGEGLDKLTILEIKYNLISDPNKKENIKKEIDVIIPMLKIYKDKCEFHYKCLLDTNKRIWNLCETVRYKNCSLDEYCKLSRDIVDENDNRFRIKNKINLLLNSNLKEQKSYISKKAMILTHLELDDVFTMNGAIRYYAMIYDEVHFFCKNKYYRMVKYLFADDKTITIIGIGEENCYDNMIEKYSENGFDILLTGKYVKGEGLSNIYFDVHYDDLKIPHNIRFDYFYLNHDTEAENKLFEKVIKNVEKYIFVYDIPGKYQINLNSNIGNTFIYNPNKDYNNNNSSNEHYSILTNPDDNIINYSKIIENALEVHIVESSFFYLANYLKLKSKVRIVYTGNYNAIDNYLDPKEKIYWTIKNTSDH